MNVGIVVVTYNRLALLQSVIDSLRKQTFGANKIIVVNNGSTDGTFEWLQQNSDIITLNQENLGGAGGFYAGLKYVAEHNFDYCWLMDDDVICNPDALEELLLAIGRKSNIGFVCSKVVGIDGCPMNTPDVDDRPTANGYSLYTDLIEYGMVKVKCATFVSVLVPVSRMYELGLPYKEYFIWGDDSEYTTRISRKYDCYQACRSVVVHKRAVQAGLSFDSENDPKRLKNYFFLFRNRAYNDFLYTFKSSKAKIRFWIGRIMKIVLYFAKLQPRKAWIMARATFCLINFRPKVEFPQKAS